MWQGVPYCKACHQKNFHNGQVKQMLGRRPDVVMSPERSTSPTPYQRDASAPAQTTQMPRTIASPASASALPPAAASDPRLDEFDRLTHDILLLVADAPPATDACRHIIQDIDRLISALSFPLPLSSTSKPNGQEVVNDLVTFLAKLKGCQRVGARWPELVDRLALYCTAQVGSEEASETTPTDDAFLSPSQQLRAHQHKAALTKGAASLAVTADQPLTHPQASAITRFVTQHVEGVLSRPWLMLVLVTFVDLQSLLARISGVIGPLMAVKSVLAEVSGVGGDSASGNNSTSVSANTSTRTNTSVGAG
jgi:hypothetical protein